MQESIEFDAKSQDSSGIQLKPLSFDGPLVDVYNIRHEPEYFPKLKGNAVPLDIQETNPHDINLADQNKMHDFGMNLLNTFPEKLESGNYQFSSTIHEEDEFCDKSFESQQSSYEARSLMLKKILAPISDCMDVLWCYDPSTKRSTVVILFVSNGVKPQTPSILSSF